MRERPVVSASFCSSIFHRRSRYPLLPPPSAVNLKGKIWNHAVKLVPDKDGVERPKAGLCHEGEI